MPETVVLNANDFFFEADFELRSGVLDEDAEHVFTKGHCHSLALAIHDLRGWPLIGAGYSYSADCPEHVLVRMPDGNYLDVKGVHTEAALRDEWGEIGPVDVDFARDSMGGEYRDPEVEIATPFAEAVLREYA